MVPDLYLLGGTYRHAAHIYFNWYSTRHRRQRRHCRRHGRLSGHAFPYSPTAAVALLSHFPWLPAISSSASGRHAVDERAGPPGYHRPKRGYLACGRIMAVCIWVLHGFYFRFSVSVSQRGPTSHMGVLALSTSFLDVVGRKSGSRNRSTWAFNSVFPPDFRLYCRPSSPVKPVASLACQKTRSSLRETSSQTPAALNRL